MTTAYEAIQSIQDLLHIAPDGTLGEQDTETLRHAPPEVVKAVQHVLHVTADGILGPRTIAAYDHLQQLDARSTWPMDHDLGEVVVGMDLHCVKATSFADPADLRAFSRCKVQGRSDQACFAVGDNGQGKWGPCQPGSGPKCALPPEIWIHLEHPAHARILITHCPSGSDPGNGLQVIAQLDDTMPHIANIKNGARIDLNKDACDALRITIPAEATVTWQLAPAPEPTSAPEPEPELTTQHAETADPIPTDPNPIAA